MRHPLRKYAGKNSGILNFLVPALVVLSLTGCASPGKDCRTGDDFSVRVEEMATAVHCLASGLGALGNEEDFVGLLRRFIDPIRFLKDSSGYFFVYDTKGVVIAHAADKNLIGKNLYDLQDKTGKYFIRDKIAAAEAGGGFVEYYWPEPKTKEIKKKRVYVEMIPGTNYLIGSGVYFE